MITKDEEKLRVVSKELNVADVELTDIVFSELKKELQNSPTPGYGLSAIQIGYPLRVSFIQIGKQSIELINPVIIERNDPIVFTGEGCLSFPGNYCNTNRYNEIVIENTTRQGAIQKVVFNDLEAIIVQHEMDHHNGILFFDNKIKIQQLVNSNKIGRNSLCPDCLLKGINIKFKKCQEHFK